MGMKKTLNSSWEGQKSDTEYEFIMDIFINNMIYRPTELENFSCYELVSMYEMKRLSKEKIENLNHIVEG